MTIRQALLASSEVICPSGALSTGVSSLISDFPKNILVPTHPKSDLEPWLSHPTRGAYHDRHGRGEGCGGRGSVLRATGSQGGFFESVSGQQRADERCCRVRRSRVVLTPRRWRQVRGVKSAQPGLDKTYPQATVAKEPGHRGARRKPLKPLRAGTSGDSGVLVYSCASTNAKRTRGCGCHGHPAFPTPSVSRAECFWQNPGRVAPRGANACL
jgi:hypothetical protein